MAAPVTASRAAAPLLVASIQFRGRSAMPSALGPHPEACARHPRGRFFRRPAQLNAPRAGGRSTGASHRLCVCARARVRVCGWWWWWSGGSCGAAAGGRHTSPAGRFLSLFSRSISGYTLSTRDRMLTSIVGRRCVCVYVCVGWGGARRRAGAAAMTLRNMCPTIILVPVVVLTSRAPWRRATHRGALCIVWSAVRPAHIILGLCAGTVRRARPGAACRAATNRGTSRFGRCPYHS